MTTVDQEYVKANYPKETHPQFYRTIPVVTLRTGSDKDPEMDAWLKALQQELDLP
jgi:hypothetical protein